MKLTRRLARLEARLEVMDEKRHGLLIEHEALRAAIVALMPIISTASASQRAEAKQRAIAQLTTALMLSDSDEPETAQALLSIEQVFAELDAAHAEADQPPPVAS